MMYMYILKVEWQGCSSREYVYNTLRDALRATEMIKKMSANNRCYLRKEVS